MKYTSRLVSALTEQGRFTSAIVAQRQVKNNDRVYLTEVGARDGLQSAKDKDDKAIFIETANKRYFLERLVKAQNVFGNDYRIEAGSFVSPKAIPALADGEILAEQLNIDFLPKVIPFDWLVMNEKGMATAIKHGVKCVAVVVSPSRVFCEKNMGVSREEVMKRVGRIISMAQEAGIEVKGYVSTCFDDPFTKEKIAPQDAVSQLSWLYENGVTVVKVSDTTGKATPEQVGALLDVLRRFVPFEKVGMHFHNTHGRALENAQISYENGVRNFDSSAGGLGGCPYAPGASGNIATEDLIYFFEKQGIFTGVDLEHTAIASQFIYRILGKEPDSLVHREYLIGKTQEECGEFFNKFRVLQAENQQRSEAAEVEAKTKRGVEL